MERRTEARNARARVEQEYAIELQAQRYAALYEEMVERTYANSRARETALAHASQ